MIRFVMKFFVRRWGGGFTDQNFPLRSRFFCGFIQNVIGINKGVPWLVHWTSVVRSPEKIERGSRMPGYSRGCLIDGRNGIRIGDNTWIGSGVKIVSMNHSATDYERYEEAEPIVIGRNCWIATNAIILAGVELGDHTIIAAGAVVTKSFPSEDQLVGGVPAKVIKQLSAYEGHDRSDA